MDRLEKKKSVLLKKIETLNKKGDSTSASQTALSKLEADMKEQNQLPLNMKPRFRLHARKQIARAKSLSEALAAANAKDNEDTAVGIQGLVYQLRPEGIVGTTKAVTKTCKMS